MPTNEEIRRGIGKNNEAARRNIGKGNEAARRQIGRDMIELRTGKQQVQDINALVTQPRQQRSLPRHEPRGGLSGGVGVGTYTPPPASTGGGGIASPLTVQQIIYSEEPSYVATFDASGYFAVKKIARIVMVDAEGRQIIVEGFAALDENGNPKPPENPNG
ncbi:hypothetical protein F7R01_00920 [Pseudomonas argentinensis]|uniref:Uncharacterized protein n=1 Tax=Phytopseudomonas argentinensis TaxID=289370 RepID=A0A1I3NSY5_9GAMM|nr:hypothetical protein [Pseudomonas argentinensis]KAB0549817.1 hypothetical protein F7R01_00920 [Pseudomonas argentinensis]SFJ12090.1 hypothetical protein SAMN05216602_3990 [Pseudomonas argentinensis]